MTVKSLIPSNHVVGTVIDYERFSNELKLWYYYRHGYNKSIMNSLLMKSSEVYWTELDDSSFDRVFPITVANTNWDVIKEEIVKNVLYTTGNIPNILECIALSKLLYLVMGGMADYDEILNGVKEEIIHFAQADFLAKHEDNFRFAVDTYPKNYTIDFERHRINLINLLNGIYSGKGFEVIYKCLEILKNREETTYDFCENYFVSGFIGILEKETASYNFKDKKFIMTLGGYLYKLRKSRISPENLEVDQYYMPDIFKFREGDEFNHTLLNRSKVLKFEDKGSYEISYVQTKTGVYRFFKIKKK